MKSLPSDIQSQAFQLLVEAALADGKVVAEEREYLGTVAMALGMAEKEVERRIADELARRKG